MTYPDSGSDWDDHYGSPPHDPRPPDEFTIYDELTELRERLQKANDSLLGPHPASTAERRIVKAEGVRLAISYVDEMLRSTRRAT